MRPGGVVSFTKLNSIGFLQKNRLYIVMCLSLITGIIIGSVSLASGGKSTEVFKSVFTWYINGREGTGFFIVLFSSFFYYFAVATAFFTLGASIVGVIFSPIICCTIGIFFGGISAFSYSQYTLKGIAFNAIILLPAALTFCICALFAAKEAFCLSVIIIKLTLPKSRPLNLSGEFKSYCGRFLIIVLLFALSALVDAAVTVSFIKFFSF